MSYQFFIDKIFVPLVAGGFLFAATQLFSGLVTQAAFAEYKLKMSEQVTGLDIKLAAVLKSQEKMEQALELLVERELRDQKKNH